VTITGDKEVLRKFLSLKSETFRKVVEVVEKTAVRMANSAKADHTHGSDPHSRGRFETQTGVLVASIGPSGNQSMQFEKLDENTVVGLFGVGAAVGTTNVEYAERVEELYPFIWPAAVANMERFKQDLAACAPGAKGTTG
jgi:hypothetical protein